MTKKMITKMNEYKEFQDDMVVEMATISGKDFPYVVFVNGGNSYGQGRNEHGEPHFHFTDNVKGSQRFDLSVLIPTIIDWNQNKYLSIVAKSSKPSSWFGLSKEKKILIKWMDEQNEDEPKLTNYQAIRFSWNSLNKYNKNVRKLTD